MAEFKVSSTAIINVGNGSSYWGRTVYKNGPRLYMEIKANRGGASSTVKVSVKQTGPDNFTVTDPEAWKAAYNSHK